MGLNTYKSLFHGSLKDLVSTTAEDGTLGWTDLEYDLVREFLWEATEKPHNKPMCVQRFTIRAVMSVTG